MLPITYTLLPSMILNANNSRKIAACVLVHVIDHCTTVMYLLDDTTISPLGVQLAKVVPATRMTTIAGKM